ncbi:hypothetical protein O9366_16075 [Proteus mirabilis]|uniref:hypothetical protein n=1 Tax=Proteus mirabilis TaxID=584 RepID=UPI002574B996|nr:hypothetical protein [Proteus mirabilis]MDM3568712.1 hypothetical protein [Proteus mirabilis]MDM3579785.1 hypothetical protein [Proteus mirabilis]
MGKMTFVVEYEDGKEPSVNAGTDILGGRLTAVAFYDYRDDLLTQDEAQAVNNSIEFTVLRDYCEVV